METYGLSNATATGTTVNQNNGDSNNSNNMSMNNATSTVATEQHTVFSAAQRGLFDQVKYWIEEKQMDPSSRDQEDVTILHWAAINNHLHITRYLVERGAIVDALGGDLKSTPLQWAVRHGHLAIVVYLIKCGADPRIADIEGFNSLTLATQFGKTSIVAFLIAKGVDVDTPDKQGRTCLMWACYRVFTPELIRLLLTFHANIHARDSMNNTPLHWAALSGNRIAVDLLVTAGASVDAKNAKQQTPEAVAAEKANTWVQKFLHGKSSSQTKFKFMSKLSDLSMRKGILFFTPYIFLPVFLYIISSIPFWWGVISLAILVFISSNVMKAAWIHGEKNPAPVAFFTSSVFWVYVTFFHTIYYGEPRFYLKMGFLALSTFMTYMFYLACSKDPGYIKTTNDVKKKTVIELAETGEGLDFAKFCPTCVLKKPLRSKHCGECGACVAKFDHHCPFVYNCIGANNHSEFMYFCFSFVICAYTYVYMSVCWLQSHSTPDVEGFVNTVIMYATQHAWIFFLTCWCTIHGGWVGALAFQQLHQGAIGMTTNEKVNQHKYPYLMYGQPFSRGVIRNLVDLFQCTLFKPLLRRVDWQNVFEVSDVAGAEAQLAYLQHAKNSCSSHGHSHGGGGGGGDHHGHSHGGGSNHGHSHAGGNDHGHSHA